jgi:hypothetical protein
VSGTDHGLSEAPARFVWGVPPPGPAGREMTRTPPGDGKRSGADMYAAALRRLEAELAEPDAAASASKGRAERRRREGGGVLDVLVVDDTGVARGLLGRFARAEGWRVRTAARGAGALAAVRRRMPDLLVLVDVRATGAEARGAEDLVRALASLAARCGGKASRPVSGPSRAPARPPRSKGPAREGGGATCSTPP